MITTPIVSGKAGQAPFKPATPRTYATAYRILHERSR